MVELSLGEIHDKKDGKRKFIGRFRRVGDLDNHLDVDHCSFDASEAVSQCVDDVVEKFATEFKTAVQGQVEFLFLLFLFFFVFGKDLNVFTYLFSFYCPQLIPSPIPIHPPILPHHTQYNKYNKIQQI